jgi:predicted tellurium resistance membrane protein TerC
MFTSWPHLIIFHILLFIGVQMLAQAQSQFRQVSWSQVLVSASVFMMMLYRMGGLSLTTWLSWHMDWSTLGYVSSWSWMRPFALPDLGSVVWSFLRAGLSILACLIAFIVALWKLELRGAGKMVALIPIMLPFASLHRTAVGSCTLFPVPACR